MMDPKRTSENIAKLLKEQCDLMDLAEAKKLIFGIENNPPLTKMQVMCKCDSRQLFNFGHEKGCIERKL